MFDDEDADSIIKFKYGIRAIIIISKRKADGESCRLFGMPGAIRTRDLSLRRSPRGAFSTPCKSPKILDFTGVSGVSLLLNSRPKPANFSWFFAFLLAGY